MKITISRFLLGPAMLATALLLGSANVSTAEAKDTFSVAGIFVEGCSCSAPCPCELVGLEKGCNGVGAMSFTGGEFNGASLAGAKVVYTGVPGEYVNLYVSAPDAAQRDAAMAFAKAYYSKWGKIEIAREADISIKGDDGKYTVKVDDGKVLEFKTEPVLGGDGKTPVTIGNTKSLLTPTVLQARTVSGKYQDGSRSFSLKDSNSYFQDKLNSTGKL